MITIASLIYKSTKYADAVWNSAHKYTPHLSDGRARFLFVANDATQQVKDHLIAKNYPHVIQENKRLTNQQMIELNIAPPEHIRRIYQGFNRAILESDEIIAIVNSDMMFSPGWMDALLREFNENTVVVSKLVERKHPKHGCFKRAIERDFGSGPDNFKESDFIDFCSKAAVVGVEDGGGYSPCMMLKEKAVNAGLYPEGNIGVKGSQFLSRVWRYGDQAFFKTLSEKGVAHKTVTDSLVYHFKEGEMSE